MPLTADDAEAVVACGEGRFEGRVNFGELTAHFNRSRSREAVNRAIAVLKPPR